jgi:RND superfamily putative drug exporter
MTAPNNPKNGQSLRERTWLRRWGEWCARRPWRVIVGWLALVILTASLAGSLHPTFSDNVTLSGTQAQTGLQLIAKDEPVSAASTGTIVFSSTTPLRHDESLLNASVAHVSQIDHVISVTNPLAGASVSDSGLVAYASVGFDLTAGQLPRSILAQLRAATSELASAGITVNFGGGLDQLTQPALNDHAPEVLGFAVALVVLLLVFGSVWGALLPLVSALVAIGVGLSLLNIVANSTGFGASAPKLSIMIGLGVGIDYAVFLTTRFRQNVKDGLGHLAAAGDATATSGRAILIAATTVSIAMMGLYASGLIFIGKLGLAAVFGVLSAAAAGISLVPALTGLIGARIDRLHVRTTVAEVGESADGWHRYAAAIGRHPWSYLGGGLLAVAVIATPVLSLQTGHVGDGASPSSYTSQRAYNELAAAFGSGINGPFTIVISRGHHAARLSSVETSLTTALTSTTDVAHVSAFHISTNGAIMTATLYPVSGPQNSRSATLFSRLVSTTLPHTLISTGDHGYVTGSTASQIQFDQLVSQRLILIIAVVVILAFLLIMTVFRSLFLALKAAVLNLLSIGAAYGVLVAVFQWGWGRTLIGVRESVPIEAYVPMVLFAIVFGLSMDYEIFLLARVKERWELTRDNHEAVADGLSRTGRVISAAALIMIAVFLSFVSTDLVAIKQLAVGLAASVAIDATLIRLLLVPAAMFLFGERNWWLPGWLDKVLPHLTVE